MKIFISYSREDELFARRLYVSLLKQGVNVWIDIVNISAGKDWSDAIHEALRDCDIMLLVVTPASMKSENVADEWKHYFRKKPIIPLKLRNSEMHFQLERLQYVDFEDVLYELALQNLWRELKRHEILESSETNRGINPQPVVFKPPDISNILPYPFEWCVIPSGDVTIEYGENRGEHTFAIDNFYIAKYPITNAQYNTFLLDEHGYRNTGWWNYSEKAAVWRNTHASARRVRFPDADHHPRVDISEFEAVAFCKWLSDKTSNHISLPTEQQWQRAGQGDDRRKFPWGNQFNKEYCNTLENRISHTTPVTKYPKGISPFGVMDMSGNVWEWCLISENNPNEPLLLGGTWGRDEIYAQLTYRRMLSKELLDGVGFRIVCNVK